MSRSRPASDSPKRKASSGKINPLAASCTPFHSLGTHSEPPPGNSVKPKAAAVNNASTTVNNAASTERSPRIDGS